MIIRKRRCKSPNKSSSPCPRRTAAVPCRRRGEEASTSHTTHKGTATLSTTRHRHIVPPPSVARAQHPSRSDAVPVASSQGSLQVVTPKMPSAERIVLRGDDFACPISLKLLCSVLQNSPRVTALDLSWAGLGDADAASLCHVLQDSLSVKELILCGNGLGKASSTLDCGAGGSNCSAPEHDDYLGNFLRNNRSVVKLHLGCNSLGPEAAASLAEGLRHNECLEELDLWNCGIGDEAAAELLRSARYAKCLKTLRLNLNKLGTRALEAATELLRTPTALQVLNLDSNPLLFGLHKDKDEAFIDALQANRTLRWLGIPYTGVTDASASRIFQALTVNQTLEYIDVGYNEIFKDGYAAMVECIPRMKKLKHLRTHARAQLVSTEKLTQAVEQNTSLHQFTSICVGCNKLWASLRRNQVLSRASQFVEDDDPEKPSLRSVLPYAIAKLAKEKDAGASATFQLLECYFR